ncbi:MAG TPA: Lrp/AsnC ligand binding domain-containing protein [Actinomycetota bacterium]|nr:Lrp/AsnC ligand binding domain-containing protein [Actinomycetota bacterium]
MVTTVVLAVCDIHRVPETAQEIADLPEVSEVYSVAGDYDLVIMVRTRQHEELAKVVTESIARVAGVERTQTLVAFKVYSRHDVEALFSIGLEDQPELRETSA